MNGSGRGDMSDSHGVSSGLFSSGENYSDEMPPGALGNDHEVVSMDDLVGRAVGEVRGAAAGDAREFHGTDPDQALGEDHAVGPGDLHGLIGLERALGTQHTGGEQRDAPLHEGTPGAV